MAKKASIYATVALVLMAALYAGGYWVVKRRSQTECGFCQRHINEKSRVLAEIGGQSKAVCCAHCAVTEGKQQKKPVRLIEVTDYTSGNRIDPSQAWYVDGSRVMACEHDPAVVDASKHPGHVSFDRCAPGTFAFARKAEADQFVADNGGRLIRLEAMLAEVAK